MAEETSDRDLLIEQRDLLKEYIQYQEQSNKIYQEMYTYIVGQDGTEKEESTNLRKEDLAREKAYHDELVTELKKTNDAVTSQPESNLDSEILEQLKLNNSIQTKLLKQEETSSTYQENSFEFAGTLALSGFILVVGAYACFKIWGYVTRKFAKMMFN